MSLPTLYGHYTNGGIANGLSTDQPFFTLNGEEITIFSGAMHYFRVPQEYWRDRLRKMRAAGLNTVETYVPWNLHEPQPGVYDFQGDDFQGMLNIAKFLEIAKDEDLLAIIRPGPYICSEWEFGGLPSWLLRDDIEVRTSDKKFMNHAARYLQALLSLLVALQFTNGGPIIAFQIENEYGSYSRNGKEYLEDLKDIFIKNGIKEMLFTSDGVYIGNSGQIPGVLYTANFGGNPETNLKKMQKWQPGKPSMVMEFWGGWFDKWTENHHNKSVPSFADVYKRILQYPASVNIYMFHGGTSFGFMNGAGIKDGSTDNKGFQPDTNSYDYDAPLSEIGDYTPKYNTTKELIAGHNHTKTVLPEMPAITARKAYESIKITEKLPLSGLIQQSEYLIKSPGLLSMERLSINNNSGQSYGYIVYRKTNIDIPAHSNLLIKGRVCDTVMVVINGVLKSPVLTKQSDLKGFGYWKQKDSKLNLGSEAYKGATIELVVENWGRVNIGHPGQSKQFKGLWQGPVKLNDEDLVDWEIVPLEFKKGSNKKLTLSDATIDVLTTGPTLYKAILDIKEEPVDTFVDMTAWNKGIVIVNGFVLSRYCQLGPQQTAYLPAPFLQQGENSILIFEHFKSPGLVRFSDKAIYETKK